MTRRYVLFAVLFLVFLPALTLAYNCLFDASGYYPDENLQYCKSHGCYAAYYGQKDCLSDCCQANQPGEYFKDRPELVVLRDSVTDDPTWNQFGIDTSSYTYKTYGGCSGCVQVSFNALCMPREGQTLNMQKLNDCMQRCAEGNVPGEDNSGGFNFDMVPPTQRSCVCNFYKERWDKIQPGCEGYLGDVGTQQQPGGGGAPPATEHGPCEGVTCDNNCSVQGPFSLLSHSGTCFELSSTTYECRYAESECEWGCNAAKDGCADAPAVQIQITQPADGTKVDTGTSGVATISISGTTIKSGMYGIPKVVIAIGSSDVRDAVYDYSTGQFSLSNVQIKKGRPVTITAIVYSQDGKRLGSDTVTVYPNPDIVEYSWTADQGVTFYRNGQEFLPQGGATIQEGDEFQLSGNGAVSIEYSDGTSVVVLSPAKLRFWNGATYVTYGAIEVNVQHDYEVLGRQGHIVVKGTKFAFIVPQDADEPDTLIVSSGTVTASGIGSEDESVAVGAGKKIDIYPNMIAGEDSVQEATDADYARTPSGKPAGCCGAAFLLIGLLGFVLRR